MKHLYKSQLRLYNHGTQRENTDNSCCCFCDILRDMLACCTDPAKFHIAYTTNGDLLLERESGVKRGISVVNRVGRFDTKVFQVYGLKNRVRVEKNLCSN